MLYLDPTQEFGTPALHTPNPGRKMARRLGWLERVRNDTVRARMAMHSLLQAVLLIVNCTISACYSTGEKFAINLTACGAVLAGLLVSALLVAFSLSYEEAGRRPLGHKAFIAAWQPIVLWGMGVAGLYIPFRFSLLTTAALPYQVALAAIWLLPALYSLKYVYAVWLAAYWLKAQVARGNIQAYNLDTLPPQLAYAEVPYNGHTEIIESLVLAGNYQQAIESAGATGRQIDNLVTELLAQLADADAVATDHLEGDIATQVERRRQGIINHYSRKIAAATNTFVQSKAAARDDERAAQSAKDAFILSQDKRIAALNAQAFLDETERFASASDDTSGSIRQALAFVRSLSRQQRKE